MSPIDRLEEALKAKFPNSEIQTQKSDDPNGYQFLYMADFEIGIEWKREFGFGITTPASESSGPPYVCANEWYMTEKAILDVVASLVDSKKEIGGN